jgi:hypothetical protein
MLLAGQAPVNPYYFTHGPFQTLTEALEVVPEMSALGVPTVVHMKKDGTDADLYIWDHRRTCWARV